MPPLSDSQRAVVSHLLANDEELSGLAREVLIQGFRDLRNLQLRGNPDIKQQIAKSLAGSILQFMEQGDDGGVGGLRGEFHDMIGEMRGEIMEGPPVVLTKKPRGD